MEPVHLRQLNPMTSSNISFARTHGLVAGSGFLLCLLVATNLLGQPATPAPTTAGQPPASGREPGTQGEKDWVDNRWSRTDVGPFLASNLEIPGMRIAKGLSIKVGDHSEASVCYDTAGSAWRGGWTGGFLQFDPGRFGLIGAPKINGTLVVATGNSPGWQGVSNHYSGLHVSGNRVVLEYALDGVRVLESPWFESGEGVAAFTRSFEIGASSKELTLALNSPTKTGPPTQAVPRRLLTDDAVSVQFGTNTLRLGFKGPKADLETRADGQTLLHFPASSETRRAKITIATSPSTTTSAFTALLRNSASPENLSQLAKPGPARWLPELKTVGQRGLDTDIFAVDTLTVPYANPWNALFFIAGVDFTSDGAAYVCTIHGDVWRVTGIDDKLGSLRWKRFATGLFQPLGLKVRDGEVFVLGRDQITRLHDRNGDGEADFYESFCNLIQTSTGGHDYVTSLEKDDAGNFYYADPFGAHRVSRDGRTKEILGTGFRNPNGLGASPDGKVITAAPQQGTWTPSSQICAIQPGGYYGFGGPKITPERPLGYDLPLCWIPHGIDNSSGSQVWVPQEKWGPFAGQMLHLLWGRCGMMLVLRDAVDGMNQGAVVPLPVKLLSGPNRGSFNAKDGHLYIAGSTGWQTSAVKDGALQRVRLTAKPVRLPVAWHAHSNGLTLTFSQPLDRSAAEDAGSYAIRQWNYRYASAYGSKDWSVADPKKEGRDDVVVKSARLLPDGKSVFLETESLQPVMQMEIKYSLNADDGAALKNQLWLTLNRLDTAKR